eukprot:RCo055102
MEEVRKRLLSYGNVGALVADIIDHRSTLLQQGAKVNELLELLHSKPEACPVFCRDALQGSAGQEVCARLLALCSAATTDTPMKHSVMSVVLLLTQHRGWDRAIP